MLVTSSKSWFSSKPNTYVLDILPTPQGLVSLSSDNSIILHSLETLKPLQSISEAHGGSTVTQILNIDSNTIASAGGNAVKLWDLRSQNLQPVQTVSLDFDPKTPHNFLCADHFNQFIAAGTDLVGVDAEIHIWDLRRAEPGKAFRSYVDCHHDDVTVLQFSPYKYGTGNGTAEDMNLLLSGSVDGLINIYDPNIEDEEDSLKQVMNHNASVHSAGFLAKDRVFCLSHMETFSLYQVNNFDFDEPIEPLPTDFGDIRGKWSCEYVVDLYARGGRGYCAVGSNSTGECRVLPFVGEQVVLNEAAEFSLAGAHGEEVVRSVRLDWEDSRRNQVIYSAGEDGFIRSWKVSDEQISQFLDYLHTIDAENAHLAKQEAMEVDGEVVEAETAEKTEPTETTETEADSLAKAEALKQEEVHRQRKLKHRHKNKHKEKKRGLKEPKISKDHSSKRKSGKDKAFAPY